MYDVFLDGSECESHVKDKMCSRASVYRDQRCVVGPMRIVIRGDVQAVPCLRVCSSSLSYGEMGKGSGTVVSVFKKVKEN